MHRPLLITRLRLLSVVVLTGHVSPAAAQELLHTLDVGSLYVSRCTDFSSDDQFLATYGGHLDDRGVVVWNVATGEQVANLRIKGLSALAFVPERRTVALLRQGHAQLTFWDFEQGVTRELPMVEAGTDRVGLSSPLTFSPDGDLVGVQMVKALKPRGEKYLIRVVRTADGSVVGDLELRGIGRQFHFSGDGATLFVSDQLYTPRARRIAAYVQEWDVEAGEKRREWGPFPMSQVGRDGWAISGRIELSPDGRRLATKVGNRAVVIDVPSGDFINTGAHRAADFDPNGYFFVGGQADSPHVTFWPLDGSASFTQLKQPEIVAATLIKYSRSGRLLAVAGTAESVRLRPGAKLLIWQLEEID